jgi:EAL domain-containing protein (putative c-di-GMP-specific phosphodiesterase class I)
MMGPTASPETIDNQRLFVSGRNATPRTPDRVWHLFGKVSEEETPRQIVVNQFPFQIGRRPDLTLALNFPTTSGLHAEISLQNDALRLTDLGSTNGTFVNGTRISEPTVLRQGDLIQFANVPFRVGRQATDCRKTVAQDVIQEVLNLAHFEDLLDGFALTPFFQPIISYGDMQPVGFEALARSSMPGMETPAEMFKAAEQLRMQADLSRILRRRAVETGRGIASGSQLFLNTHPSEMSDPRFVESLETLRKDFPTQEITLEIHELAITGTNEIHRLRMHLKRLNMKLAFDDFGAGQARLLELIEIRPDYLKFDRSLLKNIHQANSRHQEAVAALVRITRQLDVIPVAEGIESAEEDSMVRQFGFELGQGYFYGRPAPPETFLPRDRQP